MNIQDMIGLAVFDVEEGKEIGKVCDFIIDNSWQIQAIELEGRGIFNKAKIVSWEDIIAYGEDAVMIRNQQAVRKAEADNIQFTYFSGKTKLKDMPVLTEEGLSLGRISDVYFDQEKGNTILGLEITDGLVTDLLEGRKWLPCSADMVIGENAVVVPPMSEQLMEKAINFVTDR